MPWLLLHSLWSSKWYKDVLVEDSVVLQQRFFILHSIDLHFKHLKCHQDFKQCQALRRKTEMAGLESEPHPFLPLKVFQDPFGKFEPINNLSDRKPFHFLACPPAAAQLNSIQLSPCFQPFSQTRFITLTLLSGPASSKKHCPLLRRSDS